MFIKPYMKRNLDVAELFTGTRHCVYCAIQCDFEL